MIEQQLTDRMRAAVLDEPPLGFDPDEVVGLANRRRRQRVLASASVAATVAVLVGVVATLVAGTPDDKGTATDPAPGPEVITCGSVDFDGSSPRAFPDARRTAEQLNTVLPRLLDEHTSGWKFEPVHDGMRRVGCTPALLGSFKPTDDDWTIAVRLSHKHDRLTPSDDRYDPSGDERESGLMAEVYRDGSRIRVYRDSDEYGVATTVRAGTRLDPDGFAVELTVSDGGVGVLSSEEMTALLADRDLRF